MKYLRSIANKYKFEEAFFCMLLRENSDINIGYIKQAMHENNKYKAIYSNKDQFNNEIKDFIKKSRKIDND